MFLLFERTLPETRRANELTMAPTPEPDDNVRDLLMDMVPGAGIEPAQP
jgi:hypothetical protein